MSAQTENIDVALGVSLETGPSWLHENVHQKYTTECPAVPFDEDPLTPSDHEEDLYSSLSEGLSELSVLCEMEFSSDYVTFFEEHLKTLPSVGPPTILAYKRESSELDRSLAMARIVRQPSVKGICEFCENPLRAFPLQYPKDMHFSDESFCCRRCKSVFEHVVQEQKHLFEKDQVETIAIEPHGPYGSEDERQKAKEKTAQRIRERRLAKFYASVTMEPTTFPEYGKPLKTISYQLSNAPPDKDNWTMKTDATEAQMDTDAMDNEFTFCDFTLTSEKAPLQFVEKYYRTGRKFLTIFPDGSAQIFYPSGNLAIIVAVNKLKESVCIVQEDKADNAGIQAVFGSSGTATCYHPNGVVWIHLNPVGGQYLDQIGRRLRRWNWKSSLSPEPCVQFKPIFISLNHHIGVRIIAQDQMFVSFLAMGKQAKLNVGGRGPLKTQVEKIDANQQLKKEVSEDQLILFATKIQILSLLDKLHEYLNFPSNKQWDKIKPPSFLVAQAQKVMNLCSICNMSKDVHSSIIAILGKLTG
ncbi:glutamate-rich protein 6 [Spea bombifrons]|uniref:glutamate-rich protein 6 n=1 Tax=Spea bombifrons TaxID=233779 RepID=UPI00234AE531|nr:glutamate-rich protein 6 [Spea bombifrons]